MLKHDAMFFFAALIFLFIAWVVTGGPSRPISWAGPFLNAPAPLGSGKAYFLSGAGFPIGTSSPSGAGFKVGTSDVNLSVNSPVDSANFANPSPFRGVIYFDSSPSAAEASDPGAEYVSVRVANDAKNPIDISGWQLAGDHARWNLPQGAAAPANGGPSLVSDILLNAGDEAVIGSGASPTGISFRDSNGWHIFLGSQSALWGNQHDTIRLLDVQGRTVDVLSY